MTTTNQEKLRAFHGDPDLKEAYLQRVQMHRAQDELIKGTGWQNGKGCAIGCTLEAYDHSRYPIELGIPESLAHLEDRIFEGLSNNDAMNWPERFLSAPKVGADLSDVWPQFALWLLVDPDHGVIRFAKSDQVRQVINDVANLYHERAPVSDPRWIKARAAATAVANATAARAATAAYTAYAAAAAYVTANATAAAYVAAYVAAAATRHWQACADKLIELMMNAPVQS